MTTEATAKVTEINTKPERFSKEELLKRERPEVEFAPEGETKTVLLSPLTAHEQSKYEAALYEMTADEKGKPQTKMHIEMRNIHLVAMGMREPKMNQHEIGQLTPRFVNSVADKLREISGMDLTPEEAEGN